MMTDLLKVLFLFKKPSWQLNETGLLLLGATRFICIILALFIIGLLVQFAVTHIPVLTPYTKYLILTPDGFFSTPLISGLLAVMWVAIGFLVLFLAFVCLYVIFLFLGGGFFNE
ncbi:TPA: hypothetical protein I8Y13_004026 [Raoultella planticola]|uniref:hypothetical protein n=1 Tax=Escherichia coli TaxID=562 RepID=UPI001A22B497|nr:hypothetical protein [Escherichia coli]UMS25452.1 hypothetical protein AOY81_04730 [Escherichia coli]HAT1637790.1 hypothetical protein [Raoultella planticola]HAT1675812.1 hypothetical protein [Raoultella planticola]